MAKRSFQKRNAKFTQSKQTINRDQYNVGGDLKNDVQIGNQNIYFGFWPRRWGRLDKESSHLLWRDMGIALCLSILAYVVGDLAGFAKGLQWFAVIFGFSGAFAIASFNARRIRDIRRQFWIAKRDNWSSLSITELDTTLRTTQWNLQQLIIDSEQGATLSSDARQEWQEHVRSISYLQDLVIRKGGNPPVSEYDRMEPPPPPLWVHGFKKFMAGASYIINLSLILAAATLGSFVPQAAETTVGALIRLLPTPTPLPIPAPTSTFIPTPLFAATPSPENTATPTVIVTTDPPEAVELTSISGTPALVLVATETPQPPPTVADVVEPAVTAAPSSGDNITASITATTVETIVGRTGLSLSPTITPTEVVVTIIPTATPTTVVDELSGRIAYSILDGLRYETIVRDLATGNIVYRISNARQPDFHNGGYLLVNKEGGGIVRLDISRGDERQLTERDEDAHPHSAPADDRLVFESFEFEQGSTIVRLQTNVSLQPNPPYVPNPNGGPLRARNPIFLEDGRLAFNACGTWSPETSGTCGIWYSNLDGTGISKVSDQPRDYPTDNLGSQVLFTGERDDNWDVYLGWPPMQMQRLTDHPARDGLASASPDGRYIAFVSDRSGQWALWVMNSDGSGQQWLFDLEGSYGSGDRDWTTEKISWGVVP